MKKRTLEICCGSAADVYTAAAAGAHRVELNSALAVGGLTPSLGSVRSAKKAGVPIMVMVRPRDGGFFYDDTEFASMLEDVCIFASEGVEGLVFGLLMPDGTIDSERCRILVEAAGEREKIFHRAFDLVPDWRKAMDELVALGFDRILTSGQAPDALKGAETIREMVEYASGRIEILPGGGIRPHNVPYLLRATGCTQAHSSASRTNLDISVNANPAVRFRSFPEISEDEYTATDGETVKALLRMMR